MTRIDKGKKQKENVAIIQRGDEAWISTLKKIVRTQINGILINWIIGLGDF